ncbi:MAG: T9SS type A sorting domain-containing protein [Bacteroidales bacterium]|nr:T9SS type A sorting domain-containing protein [Bacteroidales bacterium]
MKIKNFLSILALGLVVSAFSQKPIMEVTFTADNNGQYIPLDSIMIKNLTQSIDTVLYSPDTIFVFDYVVGIDDIKSNKNNTISISQNYPNPFNGTTTVNLYLQDNENVNISIRDILGRELAKYDNTLEQGNHSFIFYSGKEQYYIFSAKTSRETKAIKMAGLIGGGQTNCKLVYNGHGETQMNAKSGKAIKGFSVNAGDILLLVGYSNSIESGLIDSPTANKSYIFQFATNIPCPGTPTITYDGQVYNTIQIYSQCWFKENLNVGTRIDGPQDAQDNDTIEKYCYNDDTVNCNIYGGLYMWSEMMQYTHQEGTQGICPSGWHLPSNEEWNVLEGAVDSMYSIGALEWYTLGFRGYDAGKNLKATNGWYNNSNSADLFDFSVLPGGYRTSMGYFALIDYEGVFGPSSEFNYANAYYRKYVSHAIDTYWHYSVNGYGYSVRCLKN